MKVVVISMLYLIVQSCGAPAKSASAVQSSLDGIDVSLTTKLQEACSDILDSHEPTIQNRDIKIDNCSLDETAIPDYHTHRAIQFVEPDGDSLGASAGESTSIYRRGQMWLSHNLVELGAKGHCVMKTSGSIKGAIEGVDGACDGVNSSSSSGSSSGGSGGGIGGVAGGLIEVDFELEGSPEIDMKAGTVVGIANIQVGGAISINSKLQFSAGGAGKSIAVVVKSAAAPTADDILKDLSVAVIIIPHAGDVYLDIMFGVHLQDIGVEGIINTIIDTMLSGMIIGILENAVLLDVVNDSSLRLAEPPSYLPSFGLTKPKPVIYEKKTLKQYIKEHLSKK